MASDEKLSVLKRKISHGAQQRDVHTMSVAKAMRLSIAKIGKELFEMSLSTIGVVTQTRSVDSVGDLVGENTLLCLLEGDHGKIGAAIIGGDVVGGLVQQQTMGTISVKKTNACSMTQTDAVMCAPLLDTLFEMVAGMLDNTQDTRTVSGYQFGAMFEDKRALTIALDQAEYFVARLTLDLALGARQGELILVLPVSQSVGIEDEDGDSSVCAAVHLGDVVMGLSAELNMILCRQSIEIVELQQLSVGQKLKLPNNKFPETEIVTDRGLKIGTGTLGQTDGTRALRLNRTPIHASQPRRRESDLTELDLPEIKALPLLSDAPIFKIQTETAPSTVIDVDATSLSNTAQAIALPELDDFPDLNDRPELAQLQN
ncbi:FliM/FliN family flagellar motor switch protein [Ascidiaceihabitans sp.]|nr:FliM/FliN family flagellar motor switch protein [Ascidiaceihabitans sp.]